MKKFNRAYKLADIHTIDFDRLVVRAVVACDKYILGYKTEDGRVTPLNFKSRDATSEGRGRPPLPLFENKKSALVSEKNSLIVSIIRLNLPFKM